jgi:hypothetical protein
MNNQKDTQKTRLNSYGQSNVLDIKNLNNKHIYEFANKKTEKLVTALYMITDCMDTDDALKGKLRHLGVELLSDMYKLPAVSLVDKHTHISSSISRVSEIISFVEIAHTMGFISEMNSIILKREFFVLIGELEVHLKNDKHFTFTLNDQMFSVPFEGAESMKENSVLDGYKNAIKDKSRDYADKRTMMSSMSFMNGKVNHSVSHIPRLNSHESIVLEKKERTDKILALLKDKEVSIKDISNNFTNCSEKTIQRELNTMVSKGQIKKIGSKRWSRYTISD